MYLLLPLIILVILGCIYAGSFKTPINRLKVVIFLLVIILFLCYLQMNNKEPFSGFSGYAPLDYKLNKGDYQVDKSDKVKVESEIPKAIGIAKAPISLSIITMFDAE